MDTALLFPGPIVKEPNNESAYMSTIKVPFTQVDGIFFAINSKKCKNDAIVMHLGDTLLVAEGGTGEKSRKCTS